MKLQSILPLTFVLKAANVSASQEIFTPERISYERLTVDPLLDLSQDSRLIGALSKDGIVSITDIPGFRQLKENVMRHLHACIEDQGDNVFTRVQKDGTVRRTFSSSTIPGPGGAKPFDIDSSSQSCQEFSNDLADFRATISQTTHAFGDRLTHEMGTSLTLPLMNTEIGDYSFNEVRDVVR
jgi:hypothetical protein